MTHFEGISCTYSLFTVDDHHAYAKFPVYPGQHTAHVTAHVQQQGSQGSVYSNGTSYSEGSTVEDLITQTSPDLTVQPIKPLTVTNLQRMSEYDNLSGLFSHPGGTTGGHHRSLAPSSVGTFYCKPWDSSTVSRRRSERWEGGSREGKGEAGETGKGQGGGREEGREGAGRGGTFYCKPWDSSRGGAGRGQGGGSGARAGGRGRRGAGRGDVLL